LTVCRTESQLLPGSDRVQPDERHRVEQRIEELKGVIERLDQRERELQSDYDGVVQALSADEARWVDFNQRFEDLEQSLAVRK
jgi:chromosome segregation ATPase